MFGRSARWFTDIYAIGDKVGEGQEGQVFRTSGPRGEEAVIKVFKRVETPGVELRFQNELGMQARAAELGAAPRVFDHTSFHDDSGIVCGMLVMEHKGVTLTDIWQDFLGRDSRDTEAWHNMRRLFREVVRLIDRVLQAGIDHVDTKSSNITVDNTGRPWMIDFGYALAIDPNDQPEVRRARMYGALFSHSLWTVAHAAALSATDQAWTERLLRPLDPKESTQDIDILTKKEILEHPELYSSEATRWLM